MINWSEILENARRELDAANSTPSEYNYVFPESVIARGIEAGLIITRDNKLWYVGQPASFDDDEFLPGTPPGWVHESKPLPTK